MMEHRQHAIRIMALPFTYRGAPRNYKCGKLPPFLELEVLMDADRAQKGSIPIMRPPQYSYSPPFLKMSPLHGFL